MDSEANALTMASTLYSELTHVPFISRFAVFAKREERAREARLRVISMTDDKILKTLEAQQFFAEVARSRDIEVSRAGLIKFNLLHT